MRDGRARSVRSLGGSHAHQKRRGRSIDFLVADRHIEGSSQSVPFLSPIKVCVCASPNQRGRRGDVVSVERERGGFFSGDFSPPSVRYSPACSVRNATPSFVRLKGQHVWGEPLHTRGGYLI